MWVHWLRCRLGMLLVVAFMALASCELNAQHGSDVFVFLVGKPRIEQSGVYYSHHAVGSVKAADHSRGNITRLTVAIDPAHKARMTKHWVFYVDKGRLTAVPLRGKGSPLKGGEALCGFSSKGGFHWFKLKTLLSDRVYKATQRADQLAKRFAFS